MDIQLELEQGIKLHEAGKLKEAQIHYENILLIDSNHPDALHLLGVIAYQQKNLTLALDLFNKALSIHPNFPEALSHRGVLLRELKQYENALKDYERAITLSPHFPSAHYNYGICLLFLGDFIRGWEHYEWRWQCNNLALDKLNLPQPLWLGKESLQNKTIFLHGEQGLGDIIQFCRYAEKIASLGAHVILGAPAILKPLLSSVRGIHKIITPGETLPPFDYYCPLMSLPFAFKTTLETIPTNIPYICPDASYLEKWNTILPPKTKPRVGLVWSGRASHPDDQFRSIPLSQLDQLCHPNVEFFCLQNEIRLSDIAHRAHRPDIHFMEDHLHDFADTAALIMNMDLVISVDTAVAHLAGAMGKPVWILLTYDSEWRWLLDQENSPWYSSARLFRQTKVNDWGEVLNSLLLNLNSAIDHLRP
jgi:tetratricopeptide (TPR) repeat protein